MKKIIVALLMCVMSMGAWARQMTWDDGLYFFSVMLGPSVEEVSTALQWSGNGYDADLSRDSDNDDLVFTMYVTDRTLKRTTDSEMKIRCNGVAEEIIAMAIEDDDIDFLRQIVNVMETTGHKVIIAAVAYDSNRNKKVKKSEITAADFKRIAKRKFRITL